MTLAERIIPEIIARPLEKKYMHKTLSRIKNYWLEVLLWIYALFIVYVALVPFRFTLYGPYLRRNISRIEWVPYLFKGSFYSGADILLNILLFAFLGMLLGARQILRNYSPFSRRDWLRILLSGFVFSFLVEFLQLFTRGHYTSASDLFNNALGTLLGAVIIYQVYRRFRHNIKAALHYLFVGKPHWIIAALLAMLIPLVAFFPFDFKLNLRVVGKGLAAFREAPLEVPGDFWSRLPAMILLFSALSYHLFEGVRCYFQGDRRFMITLRLVILMFAATVILESSRLALVHTRLSILDPLVDWAGIALGMLVVVIKGAHAGNLKVRGSTAPAVAGAPIFFAILFVCVVLLSMLNGWLTDATGAAAQAPPLMRIVSRLMADALLSFGMGFFLTTALRRSLRRPASAGVFWLVGLSVWAMMVILRQGDPVNFFSLAELTIGTAGLWLGKLFEGIYLYLLFGIADDH